MKKLLFLVLLAMIMVGCEEAKNPDGSINAKRSIDFNIIRVDSCEYIKYYKGIAHKGNCRFCKERNERMVREQVDSILTEIFD